MTTPTAIRDRIVDFRRVRASELVPNDRNWRVHPEAQRAAVAGILSEVGYVDALICRTLPDGRLGLIDGHLRQDLTPDAEVPVLVVDLDDAEASKVLATFDPLGAMAEANSDALGKLLAEIQTDSEGVQAMLDGLAAEHEIDLFGDTAGDLVDAEPQIDRAAELQKEWGTAAGQLWEIPGKAGVHRVLCGDCREPADVAYLCVEKVNGCFTSPPYAEQRKAQYGGTPADKYVEWWEAVQAGVRSVLAEDGSFFVNIKPHCEDGERVLYVFDLVLAMKRQWGWRFVDELCWTHEGIPGKWSERLKNQFEPVYQFSLGTIAVRHEHIVHESSRAAQYEGKDSRSSQGNFTCKSEGGHGLALPGNVVAVPHGQGRNDIAIHPAKFPPHLPSFFIKAFSDPGYRWLDPFLGSGTTLIAAEQLGRVCYGIEIDPGYTAVILQRAKDAGMEPALTNHLAGATNE